MRCRISGRFLPLVLASAFTAVAAFPLVAMLRDVRPCWSGASRSAPASVKRMKPPTSLGPSAVWSVVRPVDAAAWAFALCEGNATMTPTTYPSACCQVHDRAFVLVTAVVSARVGILPVSFSRGGLVDYKYPDAASCGGQRLLINNGTEHQQP